MRGGVKLHGGVIEGPVLWAGQRWMRVVELAAPGAAMVDGLTYARDGQAKKFLLGPGRAEGHIQGRESRPYLTTLTLTRIADEDWTRVIGAMADGAMYSAKLLAGELPANIEDLFGPLGLRLFPAEPADIVASCTCAEFNASKGEVGGPRWCKHTTSVAYLLGQRLANEPFLMFSLRGLEGTELLERLREKRSIAAGVTGARVPVYQQHIPGLVELGIAPLESSLANFWESGPGLADLDIPLSKPEVAHPLLRRLGPSPLAGKFPIVGLLASCYDVISEDALRSGEIEAAKEAEAGEAEASPDGTKAEEQA